jgi:arrestin-related trafficking adapter 4/5/7
MSFSVSSSPSVAENPSPNGIDEDTHHSALYSAFHPLGTSHQLALGPGEHDFLSEKSKTGLEIIFNPEIVCMKGTGPDVEPALLSGHVALYLTESTSFKEITLSFRGKTRLPVPSHEPSVELVSSLAV